MHDEARAGLAETLLAKPGWLVTYAASLTAPWLQLQQGSPSSCRRRGPAVKLWRNEHFTSEAAEVASWPADASWNRHGW